MLQKKSFISKQESTYLYGIAILMMVWHHFLGFPERIQGSMLYIGGNAEYMFELYMGYFCRICIAMYAFISGYGMLKKSNHSEDGLTVTFMQSINHVLSFFLRYWLVVLIFTIIGIKLGVYQFHLQEFFRNFFGLSTSYNGEWWYVATYVKMLLTYPIAKKILDYAQKYKMLWMGIVGFLIFLFGYNHIKSGGTYTYYLSFWMGMIVAETRFLESLYQFIQKQKIVQCMIAAICIIGTIVLRLTFISPDYDGILVLFYIWGWIVLLKKLNEKNIIKQILKILGKYSVYIWLTHTFFIYYYFQEYFVRLKIACLIYIGVVVASLVSGMFIDLLYHKIIENITINKKNIIYR